MEEKYTVSMYTTVSELPIMTDAQSEGKLSAPRFLSRSSKIAREALPEKGRVKRSGSNSEGNPTRSAIGESNFDKSVRNPDARSIATPQSITDKEGISSMAVCIPFFAPRENMAKESLCENKKMSAHMSTTAGITQADDPVRIFHIFASTSFHGLE